MRLDVLSRLRCPACLPAGVSAEFELDSTRLGGMEDGGVPGEVLEGYLVCRRCRDVRAILGGIAILPPDMTKHLDTHGNVYRRTPIADPRMVRFILGQAGGGEDHVPFDEVVDRYGDLIEGAPGSPAPRPGAAIDVALDEALVAAGASGPALDVGCGVGRGTFVLAARCGEAVGVDRSVARLRRARNIQTADEFLVRVGSEESPVDLTLLDRARVDFVVADADRLPFADGSFATVALRTGDGEGPFADFDAVLAEARRVAGPTGRVLILDGAGGTAVCVL